MQDAWPDLDCYGCGPANDAYGGSLANLVDCHSIWTAHDAAGVSLQDQRFEYVTGSLSVEYLKPTPLDEPLEVRACLESGPGKRVTVSSEIRAGGGVTARGEVVAVEVSGHY